MTRADLGLGPRGIVPTLATLSTPLRWCVRDSRGFYLTVEMHPLRETWTAWRSRAYTYERGEAEAIAARFPDAIAEVYA